MSAVASGSGRPGRNPLTLAAHRGLSEQMRDTVAQLTLTSGTQGLRALRERRIRVISPDQATNRTIQQAYIADGVKTICFVPITFRNEAVGLLVLYHLTHRAWPREERELAGAFADQMAVAIATRASTKVSRASSPGCARSATWPSA